MTRHREGFLRTALSGGAARGDRADLALFRAFDADRRRRCLPVGADVPSGRVPAAGLFRAGRVP